jgi:hypothetical protein
MAYDEDLAERIRMSLDRHGTYVATRMFGGIAFMVNTNMAVGVMSNGGAMSDGGMMVRVAKDGTAAALARGARQVEMRGRPMTGFVVVPPELIDTADDLDDWIDEGVAVAQSLPAKK